eukprot:scaffold66570_cov59-Phaeocystis_antarctica.AAC.1
MAVRAAAQERSTLVRQRQLLKASMPMVARWAGEGISQREVPLNALWPVVVTPTGRVSWRRALCMNALTGISTRSSGRWKYGQATRALMTGPAPKTAQFVRQRCTAASSAARNSPCAAARQDALAAAKFARLGASSFSTRHAVAAGDSVSISRVVGSIATRVRAELTSVTGSSRVDITR